MTKISWLEKENADQMNLIVSDTGSSRTELF